MRELFSMDMKDYKGTETVFSRPSARAVIIRDGKLLMVHSEKFHYYKLPGGGIREGESPRIALVREVQEETGYEVIPESVEEYGHVLRRHLSLSRENEIFEQDNLYYFCQVRDEKVDRNLDAYEAEEGFMPCWVNPLMAYRYNRVHAGDYDDPYLIKREVKVLELLYKEVKVRSRRQQEESAILEMAGGDQAKAQEYQRMLDCVEAALEDKAEGKTEDIKRNINYSRFDHTKRVLGWARRLYEDSDNKSQLDYEAIVVATIFHDIGRGSREDIANHARNGVEPTVRYLTEHGFSQERAEYIGYLVGQHSRKDRMQEPDIDKNLLLLMEADLLDDMGATGMVMDCLMELTRNPLANYYDCMDHIEKYTHWMSHEDNIMVSQEARRFWDEKTRLVDDFVKSFRRDLEM